MSGLSESEIDALIDVAMDAVEAEDFVLDAGPLITAVEAIVARAVNAALTEAADEIDGWHDNALRSHDHTNDAGAKVRARTRALSYQRAARIVRSRTT